MLSLADRRKREQPGSGIPRLTIPLTRRFWLGFVTAVILSFCLASNLQSPRYTLHAGDEVPSDIRAPVTAAYLDASATERKRAPQKSVISLIPDRAARISALEDLGRATRQLARARLSPAPLSARGSTSGLAKLPAALTESLLRVSPARFEAISRLASAILALELAQRPITSQPGDLDLARQDLVTRAKSMNTDPAIAAPAAALAGIFIRPSVIEQSAPAPRQPVTRSPVIVVVHQNELLIRKGERASQAIIKELDSLGLNGRPMGLLWRLCLAALSIGSLLMVVIFIRIYFPALYDDTRRLSVLAFIVLSGVAALRFSGYVLGLHFTQSQYGFFALMWVAAAAMLIATMVRAEVAVLVAALLSLHTAILLDSQLQFGVATFFSALAGIYSVRHIRKRSHVLRAAAILAGVNLLSVSVVTVWTAGPMVSHLTINLWVAVKWALAAGLMAPFLYFIGVAILEPIFGITTDLTLLELCDNHQPLLRRLVLEAPGTYAHSLGVASLAEAAAETIGAETLWVRAGALYHDIGKITRPYFFIENQQGENLHNKLSPTMSAKIITAHIADGVDLAREARLPDLLVDYIRQHHGTSLVSYFYHQAIIMSDCPGGISESAFRYSGPKPQSREAGILMLADIVESTMRSTTRKNPARIEATIARVVQRGLADGQLAECDLTLREIDQIQAAFARVLAAIHHSRMEYPTAEPAEERWLASAGADR